MRTVLEKRLVSTRRYVMGHLPVRAQDQISRWRGQRRLMRLPKVACDTSALARVGAAYIEESFADPTLSAEWEHVEEEIEGLQISTTAGGVNPGDRRAIYYLIRILRPSRVLEVGTHIGASTAHIAAALRENGTRFGDQPDLTSVDILDVNNAIDRPWERYGSALAPAELIAGLGMAQSVRFEARPSLDFLADPGPDFDFVFLDGDHSATTVYMELPAALGRLRPGGVVLLHDYFPEGRSLWPGTPVISGPWLGVERLRREGASLRVLPLGTLPWPTKLGSTVTSLALVVREE